MKEKYISILKNYIPHQATDIIIDWIYKHKVVLKITKERHSKLGDYKAPFKQEGHKITINGNLNNYAFLITLIHEFAHLFVWDKYRNSVEPHGKEWKTIYKEISQIFIEKKVFPDDVTLALQKYFIKTPSSSSYDRNLVKVLKNYDENQEEDTNIYIEQIPLGCIFKIKDGRKFRKESKLRVRYKCLCLDNNKSYLFSPLAAVFPIENEFSNANMS